MMYEYNVEWDAGEGTEDVNLLASSALMGHLNGMKENGINIVNATILAKDAGLVTNARHVKTSILKDKGLDKLLQLTVKRGPTILELIGSVQSGNSILFAINNSWFPFGATLSGNVLLFSGKRPDATLSTILGTLPEIYQLDHDYQIGHFVLQVH